MKGMYRVEPDRAAMEIIHRKLCFTIPLDTMLKNPAMERIIKAASRRHMARRSWRDLKAEAAKNND
jgi:hypothetical protein